MRKYIFFLIFFQFDTVNPFPISFISSKVIFFRNENIVLPTEWERPYGKSNPTQYGYFHQLNVISNALLLLFNKRIKVYVLCKSNCTFLPIIHAHLISYSEFINIFFSFSLFSLEQWRLLGLDNNYIFESVVFYHWFCLKWVFHAEGDREYAFNAFKSVFFPFIHTK